MITDFSSSATTGWNLLLQKLKDISIGWIETNGWIINQVDADLQGLCVNWWSPEFLSKSIVSASLDFVRMSIMSSFSH